MDKDEHANMNRNDAKYPVSKVNIVCIGSDPRYNATPSIPNTITIIDWIIWYT